MAQNLFVTDPATASLIQSGLLQKEISDPLLPLFLMRKEFKSLPWGGGAQEKILTKSGVPAPKMTELAPLTDPVPTTYGIEQWPARIGFYGDSIDSDRRVARLALSDLVKRDAKMIGVSAAQSLNRLARTGMYNPAGYGQTRVTATAGGGTVFTVPHLNGFTHVFSLTLRQWVPVGVATPLIVYFWNGATWDTRNVIGATPDTAGDVFGPGTITVSAAYAPGAPPWPCVAATASYIVWAGGGHSVADIAAGDVFTMASIRQAVGRLEAQNVPRHADGYYHAHFDSVSKGQLYADAEFQLLHRGTQFESDAYRQFLLDAEVEGCKFYLDQETPRTSNVPAAYGTGGDFFAGETATPAAVPLHRVLICGAGSGDADQADGLTEYTDPVVVAGEEGLTGKVGEWDVNNNGIKLVLDGVQMIVRAPIDRMQNVVSTSWGFSGTHLLGPDYVAPTLGPAYSEATFVPTVSNARYKRVVQIIHGATE